MAHSVIITTPMPTLDELGERLGLTRAQQDFLIRLVDERGVQGSTAAKKTAAKKAAAKKAPAKKAAR